MPRFPHASRGTSDIVGSVYSNLAHKLASYTGEIYPLHIGDTWLEPAVGCRMQDIHVEDHPGMHRYASPQGMPGLIDAIVERSRARTQVSTERQNVLVAAGATGGLGAVVGAILDPGDEVLLLSPYWPLISGIVRCFRGKPIDVPVVGTARSASEATSELEAKRTAKTAAVYLNSPNNPSGCVLPEEYLAAIVDFAARHDLWVLSDEVYEDYVYEGRHAYTRALDPQRTFSVHSFSKAFGMAGNRCGYVVGPSAIMKELVKVSTHAFYSTPTASQIAATRALDGRGDAWIADVAPRYAKMGAEAAAKLGVPAPEGSTFLFLDVADKLDERGLAGFLEDCADRGLFLAPGPSFGPYPTHVRLCFTCSPPDIVERGVDVLANMLRA